MSPVVFSDEILMAYADGELDATTAAQIDEAVLSDPALAERVALFDVTRAAALDADAPAQPVSADLLAAVQSIADAHASPSNAPTQSNANATIVPFAAPKKAEQASPQRRSVWHLPLAASIALVVGLAGGSLLPISTGQDAPNIALSGLGNPGLTESLSTVMAGTRVTLNDGSGFEAIASFEDGDGALCREFELDETNGQTLVSVACYQNESWDLRFAVSAGSNEDGFAPASSLEALDAYLMAINAGEPLGLEDEQIALERLAP